MSTPPTPTDPIRAATSPARKAAAVGPLSRLLFGDVPERRGPLTLTLLSVLVYALFALVVNWQARMGLMDARDAATWSAIGLSGILGFYALIRTGLSRRLGSDPSMTFPQITFSSLATVYGYAIDPPMRGAVIAIMVLNLMWGMFVLRDRQTLGLCAFGLALLAATMGWKIATRPDLFPPRIEMLNFAFAAIVLVAAAVVSMRMGTLRMRLAQRKGELQQALATIRELAQVDELTRLSNRRHVIEALAAEQVRCLRSGRPLSVVLIDLDHFKAINDQHGHAVGDAVLCAFADALRGGLRESDAAGRWGGEEFLLLLPDTSAAAAAVLVDRLRDAVARMSFDHVLPGLRISFSAGVTECAPDEHSHVAIERADQAMYLAKEAGRARTTVHGRDALSA
ncbi:GGDEF domain-containing protein [Scleromatobacter humisilvae]|uniref:diguanylate cyclase n=1 Tax=Scleromatobacter humisilvae TaxID=2897159 RepID=A0A9X2C350_9BURK|nr:GGDEF domain-containing protein [Scleromatobacter humisilvae]MCK9686840.1 GGDEF domain-containing protein [Scleromatobacter humisilvae]